MPFREERGCVIFIALFGVLALILFRIGPTCVETLSLLTVIGMMVYAALTCRVPRDDEPRQQDSPRTQIIRKRIQAMNWRILLNKANALTRMKLVLTAREKRGARVSMLKTQSLERMRDSYAHRSCDAKGSRNNYDDLLLL